MKKLGHIDKSTEEYTFTGTQLVKDSSPRGLGCVTFLDKYHQVCTIQDSSLATEAAIWLGVSNTGISLKGPSGQPNEDVNSRMHLTQEMVKQLLPILTEFAKKGSYIASMDLEVKKDKKNKPKK